VEDNGSKRKVEIACQGGASHTASTAVVLKRPLTRERETHKLVALSSASGGGICRLRAWCGLRTCCIVAIVPIHLT
jgi:NTE family protein